METRMIAIKDFPKLPSPFIRTVNENGNYVVTNEIDPNCAWAFGEDVAVLEKLDGSNTSIVIENGTITSIWNRTERLPFFNKGKSHYIQGVMEAYTRGFCELPDGQHWGELCGEKLSSNPLKITGHLWIPFQTFGMNHLRYKAWGKYPKDFETIKKWLFAPIDEGGIFSLFMRMKGIKQKPEGIVFHHLKTGQMCKLRLDMYSEYYAQNPNVKRHHKKPEEEA